MILLGTITKQDQFIGRSPIKSPIKQLAKKPRLELSPMKSGFYFNFFLIL